MRRVLSMLSLMGRKTEPLPIWVLPWNMHKLYLGRTIFHIANILTTRLRIRILSASCSRGRCQEPRLRTKRGNRWAASDVWVLCSAAPPIPICREAEGSYDQGSRSIRRRWGAGSSVDASVRARGRCYGAGRAFRPSS